MAGAACGQAIASVGSCPPTRLPQQGVGDQAIKRVQVALAGHLWRKGRKSKKNTTSQLSEAAMERSKGDGSSRDSTPHVFRWDLCQHSVPRACTAVANWQGAADKGAPLLVPLTRGRDRSTDTFHHMCGSRPGTKCGWAASTSFKGIAAAAANGGGI
jgi:hypothetical protein